MLPNKEQHIAVSSRHGSGLTAVIVTPTARIMIGRYGAEGAAVWKGRTDYSGADFLSISYRRLISAIAALPRLIIRMTALPIAAPMGGHARFPISFRSQF